VSHEKLLAEIKSQGYWRVEIHSTEYQDNRLPSRAAMQNLLSNATVSLRGWPYPYFNAKGTVYNDKWLESQVEWSYYREYWRLYESGQWLHYTGLSGARMTREELFAGRLPLPPQHAGYLHVRGDILYTLTEIFHFAVGLAHGGILDPTAFMSIQLHNTRDYMLFESPNRFFPHEYVNQSGRLIEQQKSITVGQLAAIADEVALKMAIKVFSVFGWVPGEAAVRNLSEDQKKLVERRS